MKPEEINILPERVRAYIHHLETDADPSGTLRENFQLREQVGALQRLVADDKTAQLQARYCAALTGLLANPSITIDHDSTTIGRAQMIASRVAREGLP